MNRHVTGTLKLAVIGVSIGLGFAIGSAVAGASEPDESEAPPAQTQEAPATSEVNDEPSCANHGSDDDTATTTEATPAAATGSPAPAEPSETDSPESDSPGPDDDEPTVAAASDDGPVVGEPAVEDAAADPATGDAEVVGADEPAPDLASIMIVSTFADDVKLKFKQKASSDSGDAISGSQTVGVVGSGDASADASNTLNGDGSGTKATSDSGTATSSNELTSSRPLVGGDMTVNATTISGPVTYQIIVQDDLKITFKQKAGADSGDALAGSQVVGLASGGDGTVIANNGSGGGAELLASSGFASALNSLLFNGPLVGGNLNINAVNVTGPITWSLLFNDIKIKIKQEALSDTGDALAGGQSIGVASGGNANVHATNSALAGVGARTGSGGAAGAITGDSSATNTVGGGAPPAFTGGGITTASDDLPIRAAGTLGLAMIALAVAANLRRRDPRPALRLA